MTRPSARRRAGLLGALTALLVLPSTLLMAPAASADVISSRDVTAGPVNRGVIAITSVTCERTDAPGDFGRLTISGDVLTPPVLDGTVSIRVNDKVTDENFAFLPLAAGSTTFTTTIAADGLRFLPAMELVVSQLNPVNGVVSQRDRVVTNGRCGWPDVSRLPVPTATSVAFDGLVPTAQITNASAFGLTVNVAFTTCVRAPEATECTLDKALTRVLVPAGATVPAVSPEAVAPDTVLVVETGIVGRDRDTSRYRGAVLLVSTPSAPVSP
jgi:hypothetical protein